MITIGLSTSQFGPDALYSVAYSVLTGKNDGFVLDVANDVVLVRDSTTYGNNFLGTITQALTSGILVYSSPSTKYIRNSAGILVSDTTLRCHYNTSASPLGLLPEPQRTNLLLRSCEFDNSGSWSSSVGTTITPNATTAPDGTTTADLWVPPAASATYILNQSATVTSGADYTASIYIKKYGLLSGGTFYWREDAADILGITLNLSTMTINTGTGTVENVGNGWYRLAITGSVAGTTWRPQIRWAGPNADGSGIYLWGAQLEAGLYSTSFIKTEGSTVTRNADNIYVDLTKIPFGAEYTVIAHAQPSPDNAASGIYRLVEIDDATTNNRAGLVNSTAGEANLRLFINSGGASSASLHAGVGTTAAAFKAAFAASADDFEFVLGGASRGTDVSGAMPLSPTHMRIGCQASGAGQWSAPIGLVAMIPERLTQAEMIARTS